MPPNPEHPDHHAETAPETQTENIRQRGGAGSGLPPIKTAVGFDGERNSPTGRIQNAFGIDFGEENCRIAGLRNGRPFFIPPGVCPSTIKMDSSGDTDDDSGFSLISGLRSKLRSKENQEPSEIDDLVKAFFAKVRTAINSVGNISRPKVVVTVPAYYCSNERMQVARCATAAGFEILGLINDYAAVVHSFVVGRANRFGTILILSIGAEAVSTALVRVEGALIETLSSQSAPGFGGAFVLDAVANQLLQKSESLFDLSELSTTAATEWREHARGLLFNYAKNNERITVAGAEQPYVVHLPNAELQDILALSLSGAIRSADEVLKESGVSRDQLNFVLIVGGIVSNSVVAKYIAQSLPRLHRMILNVDRAAPFGAALRAGVLAKQLQDPLLWDVLTQPIYRAQGESKQIVVPVGISLPISVHVPIAAPDTTIEQLRAGTLKQSGSLIPIGEVIKGHDFGQLLSLGIGINSDGVVEVARQEEEVNESVIETYHD